MYKLSPDIDLSFLLGIDLLQVCVGKNEVILNFTDDVRITLLSEFLIKEADQELVTFHETSDGAQALVRMLNDEIEHAKATKEGGLLIAFRSGTTLGIPDTSEVYESFWISKGERQIIV